MMQALVWTAPRRMEMQEQDVPDLHADEVLIKVAYAGICGSELSGYLGHNALRVPPLIMGHEFSGSIVAVGDNVDHLHIDQPVTVNPLYCKGESDLQKRGLDQLCPTRQLIGAHQPGAFAQFVAVPARTVTVLPDGLSLRVGALTEPVGCAVRIGELAGDIHGEDCLVIGAGPIGLLTTQVLLLNGAKRVFIADLDAERLAMGGQLGAVTINPASEDVVQTIKDTCDGGVAVAVDAVGLKVTRAQCVSSTRPTGTVILSGLHEEVSEMPAADIIRREIVVRGSFAYSPANFGQAVSLLAEGKIHLTDWTIDAPLADGGKWFDRLIDAPGNVAKVLLVPPD